MSARKIRKYKAWLITWEWIGDHAEREDKIAAILDPRKSASFVREYVELLYLNDKESFSLNERILYMRNKNQNPYPAIFGQCESITPQGKKEYLPWHGMITCGHNPSLMARLVDDLYITCDKDGNEVVEWSERKRPVISL